MSSQLFFQDNTDATKKVAIDPAAISTATTRTITVPDRSGTLFEAASNAVTTIANLAATNVQDALAEHQGDIDLLAGAVTYAGGFDPSSGAFPAGAVKGELFKATTAGTIDGKAFAIGDVIIAEVATPATGTIAANWTVFDNTEAVSSVFGRSGAIVAVAGDYTAAEVTNVAAGGITSVTVQAALNELDTEKLSIADAASTANAKGASLVGIEDAAGTITATDVEGALVEIMGDLDATQTAVGVADGATDLGTFTGTIISDNGTVKAGIQELETDVVAIQTATGIAPEATDFGTFTGTTITDNVTLKVALQELETAVEASGTSALADGSIYVGNASNVASPVALSGDVTITNAGVATVVAASDTVAGKVELATPAEVVTGTSTTLAVTPAGVAGAFVPKTGDWAVDGETPSASETGFAANGNTVVTKTLDPDATTQQEIADVLMTLITALRAKGIVNA